MTKSLLLALSIATISNAGALQDWADQTFSQGKYQKTQEQIKQEESKAKAEEKPDYEKATSLQDAVDMMFDQGKYAKKQSKESTQDTSPDYSKASSLQDAVDMMFDQGKYSK
jgi:hypothetical protein